MLNQELFGTLTNGTPITGTIDDRDPTGRSGVVHAEFGGWQLTAQDSPSLINISGEDINIVLEELTIADVNALRALLATDFPEQLLAAALAYGQGAAAPPAWEGAPIAPSALTVALAYQEGFEEGADTAIADLHAAWKKRHPEAAPEPSKPFVNDNPTVTVFDDGSRSGVRVARHDRPDGKRSWLDFTTGDSVPHRVLVGVDLVGGRHGLELIIHGNGITSDYADDTLWSLDDLRQIHSDLGRLLADERLLGALAEQTS